MKTRKQKFIMQYLAKHIQNNVFQYLLLAMFFLLAIIIGVIIFNTSKEETKSKNVQIVEKYISTNSNNESIDKTYVLKESLKKNILFILVLFFFASSMIGKFTTYFGIGMVGFRIRLYNFCHAIS